MPKNDKFFEMKLTQTARGLGGDKYQCEIPGKKRPQVLYFDQTISRPNGKPEPTLKMTIGYVESA